MVTHEETLTRANNRPICITKLDRIREGQYRQAEVIRARQTESQRRQQRAAHDAQHQPLPNAHDYADVVGASRDPFPSIDPYHHDRQNYNDYNDIDHFQPYPAPARTDTTPTNANGGLTPHRRTYTTPFDYRNHYKPPVTGPSATSHANNRMPSAAYGPESVTLSPHLDPNPRRGGGVRGTPSPHASHSRQQQQQPTPPSRQQARAAERANDSLGYDERTLIHIFSKICA